MNSAEHLAAALTKHFGISILAMDRTRSEGMEVTVLPGGIAPTVSFRITLLLAWRTLTAVFEPGSFAAGLVRSMNASTHEQRAVFAAFASSLQKKGAKVLLKFDDRPADPANPAEWPARWNSITAEMQKVGIDLENSGSYNFDAAFPWVSAFLGMVLAILPPESIPTNGRNAEEEGAEFCTTVRRYERSRVNRALCIEVHGTSCKICGFDFGEKYGKDGLGFIHVHHTVPVSEMGGSYVLNPETDLIPVCPNCHAMIHRRMPPYTVEEIRNMIRKGESAGG